MKNLRAYWLTCVSILIAAAASATTIVLPTDEQLVSKSPVIVEAMVVSSEPVDRANGIWTETHLIVEQTLKGSAPDQITVREVGGQIDNRITKIFGSPVYAAGERVLAFLTPTVRGDYQTIDLFVGKFAERRTMAGQRLWTRDDAGADVALLDPQFQPIHSNNVQRDAGAFESFIHDRVAGHKPMAMNYGVENPVLEGQLAAPRSGAHPIQSNFTLITEGTVYRWFAFQNGSSANWYSYGTQTGYSGGGVNEISSAMNAWNSYTAAKISYAYSGVGSGSPGGLGTRNGVNEILFSDPLGEIAGTFNPSTGGVVGQGGFNGVTGPLSWTSPFAADAAHPQTTFQAFNITEGNLTIQDGVSPTAGISSATLAEIVAHEFGHTLGFGHSADTTALMYFQVTGLGASLRGDDQVAARWLYPNGTAVPPTTTPAPAAPSGLTATPSSTAVTLQWTNNSSTATGFWIYAAIAGGSFSRVGSAPLAANTTGANVSGLSSGVNYQFYVTAVNAGGESAASNTVTTALTGTQSGPLNAAFIVSPSSGVAGSTVFAFIDQSTGSVTSRVWTFGDGTSSTATNPTHVYSAAGTFNIVLTVSDGSASKSVTHGVSVASSSPAGPVVSAAFDASSASPHPGDVVSFSDRSSGSPTSWLWSFGDGSSSTLKNPTHTFAAVGAYPVTLTATSATSSSVATRIITVTQRNQLALNGNRFNVTLLARDQRTGRTANGVGIVQTPVFGYFSLPELTGNPDNPEVFVKILGPVNGGGYWVFFGGLTDVEYTVTVFDTVTGRVSTYHKDPGSAKGGYDTGSGQLPTGSDCPAAQVTQTQVGSRTCAGNSSELCMLSGRFQLTLNARDPRTSKTAAGVSLSKGNEFGFYNLVGLTGDPDNLEVFVKMIDARLVDGHFWLFYGGLTDFEFTLSVVDTATGKMRSYLKPAGSACGGFDLNGF